VIAEFDEVATGERTPGLLQAATRRETAEIDRREAETLDELFDECGRFGMVPRDEDHATSSVLDRPFTLRDSAFFAALRKKFVSELPAVKKINRLALACTLLPQPRVPTTSLHQRREQMTQTTLRILSLAGLVGMSAMACTTTGATPGSARLTSTALCKDAGGTYSNGTCHASDNIRTAQQLCEARGGVYFDGGDYCEVSPIWKQ